MLAQDSEDYDHYTPEEYLALEEKAEYKSEYRHGKIFALAGASINHNRIAKNSAFAIDAALSGKRCETFIGDVRLWIEQKQLYTYPDLMLVCGDLKFVKDRTDTITNPKVIIEILSESTAAYWTLDSFEEYVLIDQDRIQVEYFRKVSEKEWKLLILTKADDVLKLESVEVEIPLSKIYHNVTWEE